MNKDIEEGIEWKKSDQKCCVIVSCQGKTYQVALNKKQQKIIAQYLGDLFGKEIPVLPDELPIELP